MNAFDLDTLTLTDRKPARRPSWMKPAKGARNASCAACKTQYLAGELNAAKHCRHCADERGEQHPMNEVQS